MDLNGRLDGRRVLVTGASSGIGAAVCRALAADGAGVAMLARRKERLDALRDELGERTVAVPCDVTDHDALEVAIAGAADALGGLDGVVTVAGQAMAGGLTSGTPSRWRDLFELNLLAPLATIRFAADHLTREAGTGAGRRDVVLVGSAASLTPMPGVGIYGASKRGLQAAFDSLRLELATDGINASLVMPGMFETEGLTIEGMVIDGDVPPADYPLMTPDTVPADPAVLGDIIAFMLALPAGVCINELVARPTGQYNP